MNIKGLLFKDVSVNPVIRFLTYADILMLSGWGLVTPILAIFISDHIPGGNVAVVGLASTLYFLVKSFLQIPIARFIDKHRGEFDDFWVMILGFSFITFCAFLYLFINNI